MGIAPRCLVIGLAGPFGSGCTTAAVSLRDAKGFHHVSLSEPIKDRFRLENPGAAYTRTDLQRLGNRMRVEAGQSGALAMLAMWQLHDAPGTHSHIVVDGIRNLGEVAFLRDLFGSSFFLIALDAPVSDRWERLQDRYIAAKLTPADFNAEDDRDAGEEGPHGQQVERCVDAADVFIVNSKKVNTVDMIHRLHEHLQLLTGERPRFAVPTEIYMNLAYSAAHGSKCLKRQVGAVLVAAPPNEQGEIVGTGFNENPPPTKPCVDEPKYGATEDGKRGRCFRDRVRSDKYRQLVESGWLCPVCGKALAGPIRDVPPWTCAHCDSSLDKMFWPDRAMSVCTAIHAEVAAVLSAGPRARGATLYTTTFPCFQCTEKIIQAGVAHIVFTEFYPDVQAGERLVMAGVAFERFEGIRSRRFHEIFSRARPYADGALDV